MLFSRKKFWSWKSFSKTILYNCDHAGENKCWKLKNFSINEEKFNVKNISWIKERYKKLLYENFRMYMIYFVVLHPLDNWFADVNLRMQIYLVKKNNVQRYVKSIILNSLFQMAVTPPPQPPSKNK